jgi:hypothetical protein
MQIPLYGSVRQRIVSTVPSAASSFDMGRFTEVDLHRRALLRRAVGTSAAITMAATVVFVAPASADHTANGEECRKYAQVPNPFVKIVAEHNQFDTNCLKAPAERDFRIYLQNNDSDPHNLSIYSKDPADGKAEQFYKGKAVKGPQQQEEYAIEGLPSGTYYFQDDKVPDMNGKLQVEEKKK